MSGQLMWDLGYNIRPTETLAIIKPNDENLSKQYLVGAKTPPNNIWWVQYYLSSSGFHHSYQSVLNYNIM